MRQQTLSGEDEELLVASIVVHVRAVEVIQPSEGIFLRVLLFDGVLLRRRLWGGLCDSAVVDSCFHSQCYTMDIRK